MIRHFSVEQWIDFVRNVVPKGDKALMKSHLAAGCEKCLRAFSFWKGLRHFADRETAYSPSKDTIRILRAIARGDQFSTDNTFRKQTTFTHFSSPNTLVAGTRSPVTSSRKICYEYGSYRIDLQIDRDPDYQGIVLTGQVLDAGRPDEYISPVPVKLLTGKRILAESVTNRHGEFQIEFCPKWKLHSTVTLPREEDILMRRVGSKSIRSEGLRYVTDSKQFKDRPVKLGKVLVRPGAYVGSQFSQPVLLLETLASSKVKQHASKLKVPPARTQKESS